VNTCVGSWRQTDTDDNDFASDPSRPFFLESNSYFNQPINQSVYILHSRVRENVCNNSKSHLFGFWKKT